ncbi:hypothetical protein NKJ04_17370 [Mesorhizobium sp. M0618]|uniref:hypothetical protein n=1 Tax=Mesorhizobium sp. M0618 TaxID=2956972 RepID=UPI003335543E
MSDDHHRFCRISYWKRSSEGHLTSSTSTDWDECVVGPVSTYSPYGEQRFINGKGGHAAYQRNALVALLQQAYERGKRDKLTTIKNMLEIP